MTRRAEKQDQPSRGGLAGLEETRDSQNEGEREGSQLNATGDKYSP